MNAEINTMKEILYGIYFTHAWVWIPLVILSTLLAVLLALKLADKVVDDKAVGLQPLEGCLWDNGVLNIKHITRKLRIKKP